VEVGVGVDISDHQRKWGPPLVLRQVRRVRVKQETIHLVARQHLGVLWVDLQYQFHINTYQLPLQASLIECDHKQLQAPCLIPGQTGRMPLGPRPHRHHSALAWLALRPSF
jgi:hypothetical protein